jgi:hypothetical protein
MEFTDIYMAHDSPMTERRQVPKPTFKYWKTLTMSQTKILKSEFCNILQTDDFGFWLEWKPKISTKRLCWQNLRTFFFNPKVHSRTVCWNNRLNEFGGWSLVKLPYMGTFWQQESASFFTLIPVSQMMRLLHGSL